MTPYFKYILLVLLNLLCLSFMASAQENLFNLMSYNIRVDHNYPGDTVNTWEKRKDYLVGLIKFHETDIFGIQEGLPHQLEYIKSSLDNFDWIGDSREGKGIEGEYSAIFYDTNLFELLNSGTFWLSETPDTPGKSWDAALPRICTWGAFRHKPSGSTFYLFNTHFDHVGKIARKKSAEVIMQKIQEIAAESPTLLTGDFNVTEATDVYKTLTSQHLKDAMKVSKTGHYGAEGTFNGFKFASELSNRIDFIFVSDDFEVLRHATLTDSYKMRYPSDHLPVFAEIKIK